jgi:hypothetical protein
VFDLAEFAESEWSLFAIIFVFIPMLLLWFFALADLWNRRELSNLWRVIWVIVILWLPILGSIVYLFTRPPASEVTYRGDAPIE